MVLDFAGGLLDFVYFGLVDPLDIGKFLFSGHDNGGHSAQTSTLELGQISSIDAKLL